MRLDTLVLDKKDIRGTLGRNSTVAIPIIDGVTFGQQYITYIEGEPYRAVVGRKTKTSQYISIRQ